MNDSLKYTTAQKITLKNCFYALIFFKVFVLIVLCLVAVYGSRDENLAFTTTSFFHPFKIILSISIVLFVCGVGFGGIIDIYKKSQSTILIKHFTLKYFLQFTIIALAVYLCFYASSLENLIETTKSSAKSNWFSIAFEYFMIGVFIVIIISMLYSILNNRKDYIKLNKDSIEFFDGNSLINDKENASQKNNIDLKSVDKKDIKKVELKFKVYKSSKFLKSIKFILKNKKEVVMDLEEMSLSSYDNVIKNEISSRFKGLIYESSNLNEKL